MILRSAAKILRQGFICLLLACQGALLLQCCCVHGFNRISLETSGAFDKRSWVVVTKKLQEPLRRSAASSKTRSRQWIVRKGGQDDDEARSSTEHDSMISADRPPSFGDSVSIRRRPPKETAADVLFQQEEIEHQDTSSSETALSEARLAAEQLLRRNKIVAFASIVLAVSSWLWQVAHPVTPIQLLVAMEEKSADISVVGHNGRPTVVDFWAPWCENCKLSAATMNEIEAEYGDRVNFIMVNGDDMVRNGKLVEAFGVDAIPHVAMIEADGTVDTALIGPIPKRILRANLDVLIENSSKETHEELPYKMLDVFEKRPQDRRLNF